MIPDLLAVYRQKIVLRSIDLRLDGTSLAQEVHCGDEAGDAESVNEGEAVREHGVGFADHQQEQDCCRRDEADCGLAKVAPQLA